MSSNVYSRTALNTSLSKLMAFSQVMALLMALACLLILVPLQAQAAPATVFLDDFENGFPNGSWFAGADETGGSGCRWAVTYESAASGSHSISPKAADCDPWLGVSGGPMPLNANVWLKYGPFDLTGHSAAEVSMRFRAQLSGQHRIWIGHNLSNACVGEAGSPFQGQNFYNGSAGDWSDLGLDISARAGASNVCVYVVLSTDSTDEGSEFVFIDDFAIYADGGPAPVNGAELELHSIDVEPGELYAGEYYASDDIPVNYSITNHGDTASSAWDVEFWTAGRVEFYPAAGDQQLGDDNGTSIAPGETRQFQAVVENSNALKAGGTWSVRGFLKYADADADNNVAVHAFSLRPLGVKGDVVASEDAEGAFPSAGWTLIPEPDSGCNWGKTTLEGNGSTSSLSPVAMGCNPPVGALTGPLPSGKTIMKYGPIDTSGGTEARMTFRHSARMVIYNDFSLWTKEAGENGCEGVHTFKGSLREFQTGWANHSIPLTISSSLCIQLEFLARDPANIDGDNWFLIDDLQFVTRTYGLRLASNESHEGVYFPGGTIEFKPVIENFGNEDLADFDLEYGLRPARSFNYIPIGQSTGHSLAAGQSQLFTKTLQIPANTIPGDYLLWVRLAYKGNWDKEEDLLSGTARIEGPPDISVSPLTIDIKLTGGASSQAASADPAARHLKADADLLLVKAQKLRQTNVSKLRSKVQREGKVSLIVELLEPHISAFSAKETTQRQARQQLIRDAGDELQRAMQAGGLDFSTHYQYRNIPFMAITVDEAALEFLSTSPKIGSIAEDRVNEPNMESSNVVVRSAEMWASNYDGSGQAVAVLDTGIEASHSWFNNGGSKIVAEACFSTAGSTSQSLCPEGVSPSIGPGTASLCDAPTDACEHGTHVAGTVAGNDGAGPGFGVAKEADIIAVQVFSYFDDFRPHKALDSDLIAALEHVLDLSETFSIAAVNMSLGGGRYYDQESCDLYNAAEKAAIDNLRTVGIATVISAGNNYYVNSIGAPGCISSAVSVGATTDGDEVAGFSNIYPQVHLLAPGVDITSSVPGEQLDSFNGTSMAAPHVAGAFAVLKQLNPAATVDENLVLLQSTGDLVDDLRSGGIETDMRRINLGQALLGRADDSYARFAISNLAEWSTLNISSIAFEPQTPWISIDPALPFELVDPQVKLIKVRVNKALVPEGQTQIRLLIYSDDPDESPYPGGVYLNIVRNGENIFIDGFEAE